MYSVEGILNIVLYIIIYCVAILTESGRCGLKAKFNISVCLFVTNSKSVSISYRYAVVFVKIF
jgi:hypothetical protein